MSHFWSSVNKKTYIEPKRPFQAIGITDFVQPFMIQSMTKPSLTTIATQQTKKILKNGTVRVENHYKNDYTLNTINIDIIDAYDLTVQDNMLNSLNKAQTIFDLLTAGGYTLESNGLDASTMAAAKTLLRFPNVQILELVPHAKSESAKIANAVASAVTDIGGDILSGDLSFGSVAESAATALTFLGDNVAGVWTINSPVITAANFGDFNYAAAGNFVTIKLTMAYNNFKYEKSLL
jgi:hypothetical protein